MAERAGKRREYFTLKHAYEIVVKTRRGEKRLVYLGKPATLGIPRDALGAVSIDRIRLDKSGRKKAK